MTTQALQINASQCNQSVYKTNLLWVSISNAIRPLSKKNRLATAKQMSHQIIVGSQLIVTNEAGCLEYSNI